MLSKEAYEGGDPPKKLVVTQNRPPTAGRPGELEDFLYLLQTACAELAACDKPRSGLKRQRVTFEGWPCPLDLPTFS